MPASPTRILYFFTSWDYDVHGHGSTGVLGEMTTVMHISIRSDQLDLLSSLLCPVLSKAASGHCPLSIVFYT